MEKREIKVVREFTQKCPLCDMEQEISFIGHIDYKCKIYPMPPMFGYSFCNCKNIYFTDYKNIDKAMIYNKYYSDRYNEEYLRDNSNKLYDLYKEYLTGKRFMDLGCANPYILDRALQDGFETIGVDINKNTKSDKHTIIIADLDDKINLFNLPKVDVIWATHIIEHLKDPIDFINRIRKKLTIGGIMMVSMPDPYFMPHGDYQWGHFHIKEHHIMWDMDSFIDMMIDNGWDLVTNRRYDTLLCRGEYHIVFKNTGKMEACFVH